METMFYEENGRLFRKNGHELVCIEAWGENALRVRATLLPQLPEEFWALWQEARLRCCCYLYSI